MTHAKTLLLLKGFRHFKRAAKQNIPHKESNASDEKHFQEEKSVAMFFRRERDDTEKPYGCKSLVI